MKVKASGKSEGLAKRVVQRANNLEIRQSTETKGGKNQNPCLEPV